MSSKFFVFLLFFIVGFVVSLFCFGDFVEKPRPGLAIIIGVILGIIGTFAEDRFNGY